MSRATNENPHVCCDAMECETIGDCGSVTGFDLTLLRCVHCGAYVMDIFWGSSGTPNVLTGREEDIIGQYEIVRDEVAACLADLNEDDSGDSR